MCELILQRIVTAYNRSQVVEVIVFMRLLLFTAKSIALVSYLPKVISGIQVVMRCNSDQRSGECMKAEPRALHLDLRRCAEPVIPT